MSKIFLPYLKAILWCMIFTIISCIKAGEGGQSSITATVKHQNNVIPFAQVYIKYDVNEFPGYDVAVYEDNDLANSSGVAVFDMLRKGDYYLYAIGYDSIANENVFGEVFVEITKKKEAVVIDIPVITQ